MRNFVGIAELTAAQLAELLQASSAFVGSSVASDSLASRTVVNLFLEPSTRTRLSFETAAKRLGADVINVTASSSSIVKGESLADTLYTVEAMDPDVIVMRHKAAGAPIYAAGRVKCAIVNAGDGRHGHPTQALLDCLTIQQALGTLEGKRIAIVGDILHSRVARSDLLAFTKLGATVVLSGPRSLVPQAFTAMGAVVARSVERAVEGADVIMALRVQRERMSEAFFPSDRDYARHFGLNEKHLALAKPKALIMHPGPMNRGVEINSVLAEHEHSMIRKQVANGVAVRMAVLERACT